MFVPNSNLVGTDGYLLPPRLKSELTPEDDLPSSTFRVSSISLDCGRLTTSRDVGIRPKWVSPL